MLTDEERRARVVKWREALSVNPEWMLQAECKKYPDDPNGDPKKKFWHNIDPNFMPAAARQLCDKDCPVRAACEANYMLNEPQGKGSRIGNGMGMTASERRRYFRSGTKVRTKRQPIQVADGIQMTAKEAEVVQRLIDKGYLTQKAQ